ncbi:biotin-dependent carboxyltransferase family protein [Algoriphagus sp. Y33]|uniref:5-oxoprolinase subunit C family protein n=1 Tax=Algoriphagus sp. Y33 TaxID=2772483 RepID=UPI00177EDFBC|nr:allophanate hydrolase [Algoriphagus sp. Y33]
MNRDIGYLNILKTGPGTSVQDSGRIGFAGFGVPVSGALDRLSFLWVNHLLKNKDSDAALEISQPGLKIQFDSPTLICLSGAKTEVKLNGKTITYKGIHSISINDQLETGPFLRGSVLYLGIKNGFQTEKIMNSRSWYEGITHESYAKSGSKIPFFTAHELPKSTASKVKWDLNWAQDGIITVYPGPEWKFLGEKTRMLIKEMDFTISALKNRMAIQLEELIPHELPEMVTAPVFPGTVQLTSGGKLIVLMKDAQVTGGYPRILQIPGEVLSVLAQKQPKQRIRFRLMNVS